MDLFSIIYLSASLLVIVFLTIRCVALTKVANMYSDLVINLINDQPTRDNIKLIASAMYGMTRDEFERRMKNEH